MVPFPGADRATQLPKDIFRISKFEVKFVLYSRLCISFQIPFHTMLWNGIPNGKNTTIWNGIPNQGEPIEWNFCIVVDSGMVWNGIFESEFRLERNWQKAKMHSIAFLFYFILFTFYYFQFFVIAIYVRNILWGSVI